MKGRSRARAVVRAEGREAERAQPRAGRPRRDARERLSAAVERHQADDRKARHRADRCDRGLEIVEVEERLHHEEVGAAPLEHARLLRVEGRRLEALELDVAEGPDRAGDEDVAAADLARLAREADPFAVHALEVLLEEVLRELRPVRAERVRLDQLGAGADVADVDGHDAVRRAYVRLLRRAQPGHGGRDERAHAAVRHDRRAGRKPVDEAVHR